jgi:glutathione synthase/RimK-type ligase-like ATP-grasp enzyme
MKYRLNILANEIENDHQYWVAAIKSSKEDIEYHVIDLTRADWFEQIAANPCDYLLAKPPGLTERFKQLYDERLYILAVEMKMPVFPDFTEVLIYENKRMLAAWMKAHGIPHPDTTVSYYKEEALEFLNRTKFPVVGKINIGASGKGVEILRDFESARKYVDEIFSSKGKGSKTGPNLAKGKLLQRAFKKLMDPKALKARLDTYRTIAENPQKGYVLFQQFIPHDFEWRAVRIGDSFFAHKKMARKGKASGTLVKGYENPPLSLFDFVKEITDKHGLFSQSVDAFETGKDSYLVNEMQCIFGQSDPYQMLVDGKPGRYVNTDGEWAFEQGDFNTNKSYDLRLKYVISQINKNRK